MSTVGNTTSSTSTGSTTGSTGSTATDKSMLASNFDQFLTLLTTQLKNQNPLDPLDTNQFTQQLVQFASVEQQIKQNTTLTALLTASKATTNTNALGFVGMEITADGASTQLSKGAATWKLTTPRAASQATISIKDKSGGEVFTKSTSLSAGSQDFVWNGKTNSGSSAPDGSYTISVTAKDVSGVGVTVSSEIKGVVDAVDLTSETPVLSVGSITVPIDKVKSLRAPSAS
jgi:flagellar basal-body rod modification protein FlgD